jgi:hypothetical protein
MWDLDSIIRNNNRVAVEAMMRPPELERAQSPQPEVWPLSLLAKKMQIGPPMLEELLKCFTKLDDVMKFVQLVKDYLPEHEDRILGEPRNGRVYTFCYLFGKKYFPLPAFAHEVSLGQFVFNMPVELMGMSYSEYHEIEMRPGYLLLLSLVVYPYSGDERDTENDNVPFDPFNPMYRMALEESFTETAKGKTKGGDWQPSKADITWMKSLVTTLSDGGQWIAPMGFRVIKIDNRTIELRNAEDTPEVREAIARTVLTAEKAGIKVKSMVGKTAKEKQEQTLMEIFTGGRVPVLDLTRKLVGDELVKRLPSEGWDPKTLHKMTDGTKYDGVGAFADWACQQTGCVVLDTNYEDTEYVEGETEPFFKWTRHNVETLTKEWPKVQEIRRKIGNLVDWLEADPHERFRELLDFIFSLAPYKRSPADPHKKRSSYDPTEHWCQLDQITQYEEEEGGEDEDGAARQDDTGAERAPVAIAVREIEDELDDDEDDPDNDDAWL